MDAHKLKNKTKGFIAPSGPKFFQYWSSRKSLHNTNLIQVWDHLPMPLFHLLSSFQKIFLKLKKLWEPNLGLFELREMQKNIFSDFFPIFRRIFSVDKFLMFTHSEGTLLMPTIRLFFSLVHTNSHTLHCKWSHTPWSALVNRSHWYAR